jgi:hypothetical protein
MSASVVLCWSCIIRIKASHIRGPSDSALPTKYWGTHEVRDGRLCLEETLREV